jgi:hypothetical protein
MRLYARERFQVMRGLEIRGLSLTRPWPFSFVNGPALSQKRTENRSWPPPKHLIGHFIALHAAQSWDEADREWIASTMGVYVPSNRESPHSQIFAVCMLAGFIEHDQDFRLSEFQRKWFFGPYGWLLDTETFVALKNPVPCKGGQGLWTFNKRPAELAALRLAYKESTGADVIKFPRTERAHVGSDEHSTTAAAPVRSLA